MRELSEVVQGLEVITLVIQDEEEEDWDEEAEVSLGDPMPVPVLSSEEEEETQEVVHSNTPLLGLKPVPQVRGQVLSLVGPVHNTSNGPRSLGPYPVDGRRRVRSEDEWDPSKYSCCVVGSSMLNGSWSQDQVDRGGDHTVDQSDGTSAACYCGDRVCRGCGDGGRSG